jgi:hypothetical protein
LYSPGRAVPALGERHGDAGSVRGAPHRDADLQGRTRHVEQEAGVRARGIARVLNRPLGPVPTLRKRHPGASEVGEVPDRRTRRPRHARHRGQDAGLRACRVGVRWIAHLAAAAPAAPAKYSADITQPPTAQMPSARRACPRATAKASPRTDICITHLDQHQKNGPRRTLLPIARPQIYTCHRRRLPGRFRPLAEVCRRTTTDASRLPRSSDRVLTRRSRAAAFHASGQPSQAAGRGFRRRRATIAFAFSGLRTS